MLGEILDDLLISASTGPCITASRHFPARPPVYAPFPATMDPRIVEALRARGIEQLYSHQARAWDLVQSGRHVVVVTPTASGKTLCYNLPVLQALVHQPDARALYVFPTKALAQDQLAELEQLAKQLPEMRMFTYDGDTPQDARRAVRARANLVLTNPDMLHSGILPHHTKWASLFQNLRYVVIDELHAYRGVFGSHLANVLRRLRRICRHYVDAPPGGGERVARGRGARRRLDERARARRGHRPPRRRGARRLSGRDRVALATGRTRRPAKRALGGPHGGDERAARPVHGHAPGVSLRNAARARARESEQPVHPREPPQVRRVRAAHRRGRAVRRARRAAAPGGARRRGRPASRRAPLALGVRDLPGRSHLAPHRHDRQRPRDRT